MAEAVVYDRLANPALLDLVQPWAEKIYVGKEPQRHRLDQEEINNLLIAEAQKGKTVVRLKGGDPFVFGRGGEECLALAQANVPFEVVPGLRPSAFR
jgi:siroheme synthase